jgi:UDP-N-acetylmuramoyl-L-alanyl-D-glutamate--2,6-diaminopimelate ligase
MNLPAIYPVTCNTKYVGPGSTFVAIKGHAVDGADFIAQAIKLGAKKIVIEHRSNDAHIVSLCEALNVEIEFVSDARKALATQASSALGHPTKKLKIIGITGTKGKSTTTYLIEHILAQSGHKTALLGTITNKIHEQALESTLTTPDSDYLHMFFATCVQEQVEYVVMEVSSHALALDRVYGVEFSTVGFTNLYPDHQDFHHSMDDYFAAKSRIFSQLQKGGSAVINIDDEWGGEADKACSQNAIETIALSLDKTFSIINNTLSQISISIKNGSENNTFSCHGLYGSFNAYNLAMAVLVCLQEKLTPAEITHALEKFSGVPGRMQLHQLRNGAHAFVDYAHNAAAMTAVLQTLRPSTDHLIVVFGCGGDKDKTRRPTMGQAAAQYADHIILTDDNPRSEDRQAIVNDILAGINESKKNIVRCELDRRQAIAQAAQRAGPASVIALLGKGHENYYIINGRTEHFDDFEEISKF